MARDFNEQLNQVNVVVLVRANWSVATGLAHAQYQHLPRALLCS